MTKASSGWMKTLFFLILAVCALQALKGIDFRGYMEALTQARLQGLEIPPYPAITAKNGDYFQSPITTALLLPFTFLPLGLSKFLAALYTTFGVLYLLKSVGVAQFPKWASVASLLLFTHALSDAYLSLNPIFITSALLWASHRLSLSTQSRNHILSGLLFSLALALRPFPAVLIPFYFVSKLKRRVVPWIAFFSSLSFLLTFLILPNPLIWWKNWFSALSLYRHAADVLHPSFQTPLSLVARLSVFGFHFPKEQLSLIEIPLAGAYLFFSYFFALKLEKKNDSDLAFSVLLTCLYCCFATVWACGFFYCFPLIAWAFSQSSSFWPLAISIGYALLPQWAWPSNLWGFMMSRIGVQGLFILSSLVFSWKAVRSKL